MKVLENYCYNFVSYINWMIVKKVKVSHLMKKRFEKVMQDAGEDHYSIIQGTSNRRWRWLRGGEPLGGNGEYI